MSQKQQESQSSLNEDFDSLNISTTTDEQKKETISDNTCELDVADEIVKMSLEYIHKNIKAFIIDLDGTMYTPNGLIDGAKKFYEHLKKNRFPFVFLSNTGAKGSEGVRQKFLASQFCIDKKPIPLRHIYTAAEAQMAYLVDNVPANSNLFVVSGSANDFWVNSLRSKNPLLVDTWNLRVNLTDIEAKSWAIEASKRRKSVWLVFFIDGSIQQIVDPLTGELGYADWNFDIIKKAAILLSHGAEFVYTADDSYNSSIDENFPNNIFPLPGPGMFAAMMRNIMYPRYIDRIHCAGKGGNEGQKYMMQHSLAMLKNQGFNGTKDEILIIGDRFDTDIKGGASVGIKTCLVNSGCNRANEQKHYQNSKSDFFLNSVYDIVESIKTNSQESFAHKNS